ncbi:hypothetical protein [Dokdonella sp.]|uniref:hypothetical protein n=1 Tax=Dokdonella sp. TaxID=2291710 RepID=UPI0031CAC8EF|nr:hypothetical protein [Dokdonella sp.]
MLTNTETATAQTWYARAYVEKRQGTIPLPPAVARLIADQARGKLPNAPLFSRWDGESWTPTTWKDAVRTAVEDAGLPQGTVAYTLRHSIITDLTTGGLDPLTVARLAGTSIAMMQRCYGKLRQDVARDALATLAL